MKKSKSDFNLYVYKPDFIADRCKNYAGNTIFRDFIRNRKGRQYLCLHANCTNNIILPKIKQKTQVERNLDLKAIDFSYKSFIKNINKRNSEIEPSRSQIYASKDTELCLSTSKINGKKKIIFKSIDPSTSFYDYIEQGYKRMEIIRNYRKNENERLNAFKNFINSLYNKETNYCLKTIIKNSGIKYNDTIRSKKLKLLMENEKENKNKKNHFLSLSHDDMVKAITEIKKFTKEKEFVGLSTENQRILKDIKNDNYVIVANKGIPCRNSNNNENNPYYLPIYSREQILKVQYPFFRIIPDKEEFSISKQRLNNIGKMLEFGEREVERKQLHSKYVYQFINSIKNKNKDNDYKNLKHSKIKEKLDKIYKEYNFDKSLINYNNLGGVATYQNRIIKDKNNNNNNNEST